MTRMPLGTLSSRSPSFIGLCLFRIGDRAFEASDLRQKRIVPRNEGDGVSLADFLAASGNELRLKEINADFRYAAYS